MSKDIFDAIGAIFRESTAHMLNGESYVPPPPPKCYWCQANATDEHTYKNAIGTVDVCDDCKRYSETLVDRAVELLIRAWRKVL